MNKNFSRIFSFSATDPKRSFWQWLVEPVATITDVSERRQARLVSTLLLVIVVAMSFGVVINIFILHAPTTAGILAGSAIGLGVAYILTRTKYYWLGVPLLLTVTILYSIISVIIGNNYSSEELLSIIIFNVLAILLSGTLASFSTTIFLAVANFLSLLLLPLFIPAILYSNMIIPLIFNGVMSILILVLAQHRNLTEKDRLAEMAGINSTLQASNTALDARTKALTTFAEVGRRLSTATSSRQLAVDVVEQLQAAFNYYHAHIYFFDEAGENLVMAGGTGEVGTVLLASGHKIPKGRGLVGRAASTNAPVLVPDVSQAEDWLPNPLLPDTKSEISVPIALGNTVLGILDVQQNMINGLGEEDVELLQSLAGQVAISLQNTRSFEQSKSQADFASLVNAIGQKIQRTSTVEDTLQTAIRELGSALGATRVSANIGTSRQNAGDEASRN